MATETQQKLAKLLLSAANKRFLKKVVFSKADDKNIIRANASLFEREKTVMIQIETFTKDGKAFHKNLAPDDLSIIDIISCFSQINIIGDGADAEYKKSKSGNETIIGDKKFLSAVENYGKKIEIRAHNRAKAYTFDGSEPFLFELGVSNRDGRVFDKKQAKFRQINRFIEHVAEIYKFLPQDGELNILDLCCGKSYLSFAIYHYFTVTMKRNVNMVGIDLKKDVIEFCNRTSESLGYTGLKFYSCNIDDYDYKMPVHLIVSLHACDIATDIVLTKAIELGAKVILSTPCCQKELLHNLDTDAFEFVTKYPMLEKKLCDALTDAIRLERLSAYGYDVAALELTDPDDTPKNILLRAKKQSDENENKKDNFKLLCQKLVGDKQLFLKG